MMRLRLLMRLRLVDAFAFVDAFASFFCFVAAKIMLFPLFQRFFKPLFVKNRLKCRLLRKNDYFCIQKRSKLNLIKDKRK